MSDGQVADGTALAEEIRSRGHWHVLLRPTAFNPLLVPYRDLERIMDGARVELRGWDVPHLDSRRGVDRGENWIGCSTDWQHHREVWRLHQSGQFVHVAGMPNDWRDRSSLWPADQSWKPGARLGVTDALWTLGEYYTLASRLALALPDTTELIVHVRLQGLRQRVLTIDDRGRAPMAADRTTASDAFDAGAQTLSVEQLVANPRELALDAASELFARFGWNPDRGLLRENLDELWQRQ